MRNRNGRDPFLSILQLTSAAFPTGTFSHSYGFETWVAAGDIRDGAEASRRARDWLRYGLAPLDGVGVAHAFRAARMAEFPALESVDARLQAFKLTREMREASSRTGRALIAACRDVFAFEAVRELDSRIRQGRCSGHHAVAYGVVAADLGMDERQAVQTFLWTGFSGLLAVLARLVPLGQVEAQRILLEAQDLIDECAEDARTRGLGEMTSAYAALDVASMRHERLHTRLCMS